MLYIIFVGPDSYTVVATVSKCLHDLYDVAVVISLDLSSAALSAIAHKHDIGTKFLTSSRAFSSVRETSALTLPLDHTRSDPPEVHRPPPGKHSQKLQTTPVSHA